MKKLLLINPAGPKSGYMRSSFTHWPPLGLAYVAAATPPDWQVKIIDEDHEKLTFEEADLVGLTSFTSRINRAYEIAHIYRGRNTKVILGGIHASMATDEAVRYVDTVVAGEVEGIWGKVLDDFERGCLASQYRGPVIDLGKPALSPRRDLLRSSYFWDTIQTSRGCPFNCNFCSVSKYLGREYRKRNAVDVVNELKTLKRDWVLFLDDNLIGYSREDKKAAEELFRRIIEEKVNKKWWMQTSINAADDEYLLKLAAKAGCMFAFIGFETVSEQTLKGMKKGINLKTGVQGYKEVVKTFHKCGIGVMGGFIMGNDYESNAYYKEVADFMLHGGVDVCQVSFLTPYPGTALMDQVEAENRLLCHDFPTEWNKFNFSNLVQQPLGTPVETVYEGTNYAKGRLYHFPTYQYRLLKSFFHLKGAPSFYFSRKVNQVLREAYLNAHYYKKVKRLS